MDVKIFIATHKAYRMPKDSMYIPIWVGKRINKDSNLPYIGDDTGENISSKNHNFCELTALYWIWKNVSNDYIGLVHYRRHFKNGNYKDKWENILSETDLKRLLLTNNVILPKKRNYFIETTYNQYIHAHNRQDLDETADILRTFYPEYMPAFKKVMESTSGHRFNMFIMKKEILDKYCEWLFDILFKLEKRLNISYYSAYDARVFGFVAERLLDVWIITNKIPYKELPVIYMEKQNWIKKGGNFLKRKFIGK